jgi:hypothetical protein
MISLRSSILRLKRPVDLSDGILAHLNVHLDTDVPLSDFVPDSDYAQRPYLFDSDLDAMLAELEIDNDDAYREIMRLQPLEGKKKPRMTYSRHFFAGLEDLSHYYDDSKDEYYEVDIPEEAITNNEENQEKANGDTHMSYDSQETSKGTSVLSNGERSQLTTHETACSAARKKEVYKGLRLSNSLHLPHSSRTSLVRNFLKMPTHKFACRDYDPPLRERLRIQDVNIPRSFSMYEFCIVKTPADVRLARSRYIEGPVMGVSCRHDVFFDDSQKGKAVGDIVDKAHGGVDPKPEAEAGTNHLDMAVARLGASKPSPTAEALRKEVTGSTVDLTKEIGSLLALALQRNRATKMKKSDQYAEETKDWWWAQNPRWGGAHTKWGMLPHEIYEDEDPSWSPGERELQMAKRREAEGEMARVRRVSEAMDKGEEVDIAAMLAGEDKEKQKDAEQGGGWDVKDGPPKKKNKMEKLVERPRNEANGASTNMNSNSNSNDTSLSNGSTADSKSSAYPDSQDTNGHVPESSPRKLMYVPPQRKRWYKDWETIRPNTCMWDEKFMYRRIGAPDPALTTLEDGEDPEFDITFQVSCVNHHVALMSMKISKRYIDWLEMGEAETKEAGEEDVLKVKKSKWYDLFDVEQRKEFLVGVWGVTSWLCRDEVPRNEVLKMEALKERKARG